MLKSSISPEGRHAGLQKLSALAELSRSSLGPWKSFKFIHDASTGESALVCSCCRILENLELSCPVAQLVQESVQAQQEVHHGGSGCLLFLAGAWSRAALRCLQEGIPASHIMSAMEEGMELCREVCRRSSVSVEAVSDGCSAATEGFGLRLPEKAVQEAPRVGRNTPNFSGQRTVKLSRHCCELNSGSVSTVKRPDLAAVARGLSHGCDDSMKLVLEAVQLQAEAEDVERPRFDVSAVVTCLLPGVPEQRACVVRGCLVLLCAERALLARRLEETSLRVALIAGDLAEHFRHLGFHRLVGTRRVSDRLPGSSGADEWAERVGSLLTSLDVNLMLVGGFAGEPMAEFCRRRGILLVEKVKTSTLRTLARLTGAVVVAYATQLSRRCVGSGVTVRMWRDLSGRHGKPAAAVNICPGGGGGLVTVVLSSWLPGKLAALEDRFWACAQRLHGALKDGVLLPGAGRTELLCVGQLMERRSGGGAAGDGFRAVVLPLMAEGLMEYLSSVMVNTGRFSGLQARTLLSQQLLQGEGQEVRKWEEPIYDNLSVKQDAWRRALDVVFLVLQSDAEIVTGGGRRSDATEEHLNLF